MKRFFALSIIFICVLFASCKKVVAVYEYEFNEVETTFDKETFTFYSDKTFVQHSYSAISIFGPTLKLDFDYRKGTYDGKIADGENVVLTTTTCVNDKSSEEAMKNAIEKGYDEEMKEILFTDKDFVFDEVNESDSITFQNDEFVFKNLTFKKVK